MDKIFIEQQLKKYRRELFLVKIQQVLNTTVFIGIWIVCFTTTTFLLLKVVLVLISILNIKLYTKLKHKLFVLKCCVRIHQIELGCKKRKQIDQEIRKIFND
jgi:hypothetical protein